MLRIYIPVGICILVFLNFVSFDFYECTVIDHPCTALLNQNNGKPILHSLGQCIFDTRVNNRYSRFREGLLARLAVRDKKIQSVSLVPVWRGDDGFVRLMDPNSGKGRELYGYLQSVNEGGAELKLEGKEIRILGLE
jgi:hypothetical protein